MIEVEDGTGKATAESYASVADADAHFTARGYTLWLGMSEAEKEQALRRATDYMGRAYGRRWAGTRVSEVQALDWPRQSVPDRLTGLGGYLSPATVPALVVKACIELAFRAASGELLPDAEGGYQATMEKVGPITVQYAEGQSKAPKFAAVDAMLSAFMTHSGNTIRVVRA